MSIISTEGPDGRPLDIDLDRFRLRRFLESLSGSPELMEIAEPVELADVASRLDGNPAAVLFRSVGPERAEIAANVTASRTRLARAFGVEPSGLLAEVQRRLRQRPVVIEVQSVEAPAHQVILNGPDADLTALPVHLQHGADGAPYISASVDFVVDPRTGLTNVGIRRMMLRGRTEAGIDLVAPSDLRAIYEASAAAGRKLPVAFVVGCHPIDQVAATMRLPVDELGLLSALRDAPLAVVKCTTSDIRVPADAEWVLEGYLDERGHCEPEGPYGEFLGYYGAVKRNPVFHLTAITRRRDALFQTSTISGRMLGRTDTAGLNALRTEVVVWRALETAIREPLAVYATPASGGAFNVRVAMRPRVPGEARNAIAAVAGCLVNVKNIFIVDADIDIFSDAEIDWALATRFQPERDLVIMSGMRTLALDPSLAGSKTGSKAGFDLTWPLGQSGQLETTVPEPPRYDGARFATVEAALQAGPRLFSELMAATGSRDGRDIVRALDDIRGTGRLDRDAAGRWLLK